MNEQWIWLPKERYPENQSTVYSGFLKKDRGNYTVAEFQRQYVFEQNIISAKLRFSGDTVFHLYCNGKTVATGPACVGGDFMGNDTVRDNFYSFETEIYPESQTLEFFARVRMMPVQICEYSKGHGGFMLTAELTLADGTQTVVQTDESWFVRLNRAYTAPRSFDGRLSPEPYMSAEVTENVWNTTVAPIPIRVEQELFCKDGNIELAPKEEKESVLELDHIYGGFVHVMAETEGDLFVTVFCEELEGDEGSQTNIIFSHRDEYMDFFMHSAGRLRVKASNASSAPAKLTVSFIATYYPIVEDADTVTSDPALNLVLQTCKHTLKICRQTHHLDSPRHCEPLACTGDYYIESLMTQFSFGDMRLAEFDLLRTAVMLERHDGVMFHTTYSMVFIKMLYDVYMATGNKELLEQCQTGLLLLLKRFETYIGENGLVENPPSYMFVDWIYIDGLSMHHPPKALGQTCLNMFYFGALENAAQILDELSLSENAEKCKEKARVLRDAINSQLFDAEKGIYFEGLNTPTPQELIGTYMPQNVPKRYYLKHANILAAYFGLCDDRTARQLIKKIMADEIEGDYQPYFTHYLLEAVYRLGLREEYTLKIIERWKKPVLACSKGLVEGFVTPEPTYRFDHSHAWGGTPLYSLPKALMGLEILEAGMKTIRLSPSLLGLEHATAELLTPYGKVICEQRNNQKPNITYPKEITVYLQNND